MREDTASKTIIIVSVLLLLAGFLIGFLGKERTERSKEPPPGTWREDASLVSIQLYPGRISTAAGNTIQYFVRGIYDDETVRPIHSGITFSIVDESIAEVSENGAVTTREIGVTRIIARDTATGKTSEVELIVDDGILLSMEIEPRNWTIPQGETVSFRARGRFSDNSIRDITGVVTWRSSNYDIVSVSNNNDRRGAAMAISPGTVDINATDLRTGIWTNTSLTVEPVKK